MYTFFQYLTFIAAILATLLTFPSAFFWDYRHDRETHPRQYMIRKISVISMLVCICLVIIGMIYLKFA